MTINNALPLVAPRVAAPLHPEFRPAVLAARAFDELVTRSGTNRMSGALYDERLSRLEDARDSGHGLVGLEAELGAREDQRAVGLL